MTKTAQSGELLRYARRLIRLMSDARDSGNLATIKPATVKELMVYLIPLTKSNPNADTLEEICGGAILQYENGNFAMYINYLKRIIEIGADL